MSTSANKLPKSVTKVEKRRILSVNAEWSTAVPPGTPSNKARPRSCRGNCSAVAAAQSTHPDKSLQTHHPSPPANWGSFVMPRIISTPPETISCTRTACTEPAEVAVPNAPANVSYACCTAWHRSNLDEYRRRRFCAGCGKRPFPVCASSMRRDITPEAEADRLKQLQDNYGYKAFKFGMCQGF